VGKTRIALRVAREVSRGYPDGVSWVELADLRDPTLLAQSVCDALNVTDRSGGDPLVMLRNHLRARRVLVVLDNCEHLLASVAALVDQLLRAAPGLRVLATSRQGLGVPGEAVLSVSPLPVPDEVEARLPGAAATYASMSLFAERAATVSPGFEITCQNQQVVAALCRKLEGIPLAIELAAVKVRVLSVDDLLERLDARLQMLRQPGRTGPTRHQTIAASIDWSHELCTPDEQLLWSRASVFAGGFGMDAAEWVCSDEGLPRELVLDAVDGLVDKSILIRSDSAGQLRFRLLEPLREHGQRFLRETGDEERVVHRHVEWVEELVGQASMQWFGPAQERWCTTLRLEHANIRAAAEHCLTHPPCTARAVPLLGDPWFLWVALFLDEGRHWLDRALAACPDPTPARVRALGTAGYVAALQGDRDAAEAFLDEGDELARRLEDPGGLAYVTHVAGLSMLFQDPTRAVVLLSQALPLYEQVDTYDDFVVGLRVQLGLAHLFCGSLDDAQVQFDLCFELCTVTGERWLLSYALYGQAFVCKMQGRLEEGLVLGRAALGIKRFFGDLLGMATTLDLIAWTSVEGGDSEQGAVLLGAASQLWAGVGVRLFGSDDWLVQLQAALDRCSATLGARAYGAAYAVGQQLPRDRALALALGEEPVPAIRPDTASLRMTPREEQISELVADGLSNKAIAERLVIAQRTAEGHVENILAKFGFQSRSQIAAWVGQRRSAVVAAG
jgi:predicted ATPase/DNA-binding CsgD family transcriptional regulator